MKKIRYAVVGAGWISQTSFMPGVHGTDNSVMTAIVSGSDSNARKLATFHGIDRCYTYRQYDQMLKTDVADAVYIALPNDQHADYAIRALRSGVHALVEKPLATTLEESEAMISAGRENKAWLMTAYRLHTEPATVAIHKMIRQGIIGDPRHFSSHFSFQAAPDNHRLKSVHWGGPLQDLGVYCINAARHAFAAEPIEAMAVSGKAPADTRFSAVDGTIAATLRFPEGRIANFFASFDASMHDQHTIVGTEGSIVVEQSYRTESPLCVRIKHGEKSTETHYPLVDDFAGMTAYFSDCILNGQRPAPDGEEGLADMRIMGAIETALASGKPQAIQIPRRAHYLDSNEHYSIPPNERRLVLVAGSAPVQ